MKTRSAQSAGGKPRNGASSSTRRAGKEPRGVIRNGGATEATAADKGSVIYLVAPDVGERYYGRHLPRFAHELEQFYMRLGQALQGGDQMVVLAPYRRLTRLATLLPERCLQEWTMGDVWLRDLGPIRTPAGWIKCRYRPQYCSPALADYVDQRCRRWCRRLGLRSSRLDLILDGGNLVHDGQGQAILTERVLRDNPDQTPEEVERLLTDGMGFQRVCLIPEDPGEVTGHADGMVLWLSPAVLAMNRMGGQPGRALRGQLQAHFPGIELVEVPYEPIDNSATGIHVNALETEAALYMPVYGGKTDGPALRVLERYSTKPVVAVEMGPIGQMGGSLRCLTWEVEAAREVVE